MGSARGSIGQRAWIDPTSRNARFRALHHTKQSICIIPLKSKDPLAVLFSFLDRFIYCIKKTITVTENTIYTHTRHGGSEFAIRNFGYTIQLDHIFVYL